GLVGAESLEWTEIHSDLLFTAATGDVEKNLIYLARAGELYVTDLAAKKPRPVLLSAFDESLALDKMKFDEAGNRILATDQETGSLYVIDLGLDSPNPELVASDLGPITDVEISAADTTVLLLDTAGKKVVKVDCPREAASCSAPEVFAAIPEFEQPITVARATDGRVWVGDIGAQSIFAFDTDGKVVKVLESMSGFSD
ncbi:MAG: SMP-30/gluconolactonase/LRE family protein, partial [Thermoanaerobaculia bacterium]